MKETFVPKQFKGTALEIVTEAERICAAYANAGYRISLRQLYYQFVSRQPLSYEWKNCEQNYDRLGKIISDARNAGMIDWAHIEDRGRVTTTNSHWDNPGEILESAAYLCPHCQEDIGALTILYGRCPHCGEKMYTDADVQVMREKLQALDALEEAIQ